MEKFLSVSQAMTKTTPSLWILNTASERVERGGEVAISISRKDGSSTTIMVPMSWLPIEATSFAPMKEVLEAPKFLDAVREHLVRIVTDEYAELLNSRPDAASERARINQRAEAVRAATSNRSLGRNVTISGGDEETAATPAPQSIAPVPKRGSSFRSDSNVEAASVDTNNLFDPAPSDATAVSAGFRAWVTQLNTKPEQEAISAIRTRGSISEQELVYLHSNIAHAHIQSVLAAKLPA